MVRLLPGVMLQPVTSDLLKTLARNLSIMTMVCYGIHKILNIISSIKYKTENITVISVITHNI
jgi:hypothetical protein